MFGSLLIPGICALVSKKPIALPKSVVLRDVIIYAIALGLLVVFLSDKVFYPLECIFLLILFVAYLVLVFLSPLVKKNFRTSKDVGISYLIHFRSRILTSQPHSSHPSLLSFLEKEHIRSQNVRSCDRMFPFDVKHITVLLFCQANFRPIRYIHHFRQFRSTSFVQNSKHMFAYEKERNAQGNQQYSTGVFFAGRGLLTATS